MGGVRPITDFWILARQKVGYYGAYPAGFLERARPMLLAGRLDERLFHICSGMSHKYNGAGGMPLSGFGDNDLRIDIDPECEPDILGDVRDLDKVITIGDQLSFENKCFAPTNFSEKESCDISVLQLFGRPKAALIDRPYTEKDAREYNCGSEVFPNNLSHLLDQALRIIEPGGFVGVIDHEWPKGKRIKAKCVASICVSCGEGSKARYFTVWKKSEK